jgi:hypothetical protein
VQSQRDALWAKGLRAPGKLIGIPLMLLGVALLGSGSWLLVTDAIRGGSTLWGNGLLQFGGGLFFVWQGFVVQGYDRDRGN